MTAAAPDRDPAAPALWLTLLMGVAFAVIWSSAFSVAKVLVTHSPPFAVSVVRFALAGGIAIALALALGQRFPRGREVWRRILLLGLCQNTIYLGFFFTAMTVIGAAPAAIMASTLPLLVAAGGPLIGDARLAGVQRLGLALGFAGVVWIMGFRMAGGIDLFGLALAFIGAAALAVATLTARSGAFGTGLLMVVGCQMWVGALGSIPLALIFEDVTAFDLVPEFWWAFAYQIAFPGIAATLLWFALVQRVSAARASVFHFLNPIFGVFFAWALLDEAIAPRDALGVALVALGILLVNLRARRR